MTEPTLLATVEHVIEVISDSISKLLGQVVALQEKNAPIPASLPKTGKQVVIACDQLVSVAKDLADDEYSDFPTIEQEIIDAANDVAQATDSLEKSISNLQTSKDRTGAWARLVDSCKIIAEMTVLLLQIVYGAEVKKIFAMQKRAEMQAIDVDVEMVTENKKKFAEIASAAASAAVELAYALRDKAAEQGLPVKRDAMLELADALEHQAKDVMDRANELLRLPGDKGRRDKLDDALTKLKKTMKNCLVPLQEDYVAACQAQKWTFAGDNAQFVQRMTTDPADRKKPIEQLLEAIKAADKPRIREALDRVEWELDNVQNLAKRVMGVRPEVSQALEQFNLKRRGLRPAVKEAEKEGTPKLEGFWADLMDCQAGLMDDIVPIEDRVAQLVDEQLGDMDRIKRALRNGGDPNVVRITKNVFGTHKELMKAAEKCHNGWKKGKPKRMREACAAANGILGGYIKGVQQSVKDADARPRTYQDSQNLALGIEDVCAEALPIEEALILAGDLQIKDLRSQHDPNRGAAWTELQDSIEQRGPRFERLAKEAKDTKEADQRKLRMGKGRIPDDADVDAELRKLRSVADKQKEAARSDGPDWLRTNLRHVEAVQDAVAAALTPKSRLVYLANKALEDLKLGSTADAFAKGPGQALSHHLEGVVDECARVAGSYSDPGARERLKKLASQVDPILEGVHAAAARANRNPADVEANREFVKLNHRLGDLTKSIIQEVTLPTGEIQALAERVIKGLDKQLASIPDGKQADVVKQNADLADATDRLADLADFAAKHSKDYAAKHRIRGAGNILRRDPPEHAKHSLRAVEKPDDREAMRDVKTVDRRLRNAVETLVGDTATPEAQLGSIARQLLKHIDDLTEGVRDGGDNIDVPTMAGVEGALVKRLAAQVERIKAKMADPTVAAQLERSMKDVMDLTPHHLGGVHDVQRDPEDQKAQRQLTADAQALKDAVRAVMAASQSSPEEELRAARRLARDALQEGASKALHGQGPAAEAKGVDATKAYGDVERHASDVAARVSPASKALVVEGSALEVSNAVEDVPSQLQRVAQDGGAPESLHKAHLASHGSDANAAAVDRDAAARMKGEARKMQRALAGVAAALQKGQPKEVADRMRDASTRFGELAQLAEAEAKSRGGQDEQAMLDVLAVLKDGVPSLADASVSAMESGWDAAPTGDAVAQAQKLAALAGSLADGTFKDEAKAASASIPKDDRRGKRLWNASSPDFVGQEELDAAAKLEKLLPALQKGSSSPEQVLVDADKLASVLGREEPDAGARLAQMARLADLDLQHLVNAAGEGRQEPTLAKHLTEMADTLPRAVEAALPLLVSSDHQELVQAAAKSSHSSVPKALNAKEADKMSAEASASQLALRVIADAFDPVAELSLLELRDQAGDALESLQEGGPAKLAELDRLTAIRVPLLRALAVAMRRCDDKTTVALRKKAEELSRLYASLPHTVRNGGDVAETARKMDALLDDLMKGTHAFAVGLAQRIDKDLSRLELAVQGGKQKEAQALAQGIVSDLKDLEKYVEKMPDASPELKAAIKDAKAASIKVIKKVPECLQGQEPHSALSAASGNLREPLARVVANLWPDDAASFLSHVRYIDAALSDGRFDDALKRVPKLGKGAQVDDVRRAIEACKGKTGAAQEAAVQTAKRKLWLLAGRAPERITDTDAVLDDARAQWAAEGVRCRRGGSADGAVEAAKRLIDATRANYERQNMEDFDLSRLNAAAQKAKARAPRSLADVLAEIRKGRYEREKKRQAAAEAAKPLNIKPGKGAFSDMQNDIDQNLKKMVVGSSLDFESETAIQLIRTIAGDFSAIGQYAAEKKADKMIEAGKTASKHITELVKEFTAVAKRTPNNRAADDLMRAAQVLKDFAVRAKLFTSIQAASLRSKGGEENMVSFSKELGRSILACIQPFYIARIKIYEQEQKGAK